VDALERDHKDFVVDVLNSGQPVQCTAKCRHDVVTQPDTTDEPHNCMKLQCRQWIAYDETPYMTI